MDVNFVFEKGKVIPLSLSRGKDGVLGRYAFVLIWHGLHIVAFGRRACSYLKGRGRGQERAFV